MNASDRDSIFGDTYAGVPNPQIPIEHPWPTRYHGPIFTTPRFGMPFVSRPYARLPYSGFPANVSPGFMIEHPILSTVLIYTAAGAAAAVAYAAFKKNASTESVGRAAGVASAVIPVGLAAVVVASVK